jgi:hypothetical protein
MKKIATMIAIVASVGAVAQSKIQFSPEAFITSNAYTSDPLKTIFVKDDVGMWLMPAFRPGPRDDFQMGIELLGHASRQAPILGFGITEMAFSDDTITMRIEMFNYTKNIWVIQAEVTTVVPVSTPGTEGAPSTATYAPGEEFIEPITGEVRARITWSSKVPLSRVWIDFAGWSLNSAK